MNRLATSESLFASLRTVIANLPEHAVAIDIQLRPRAPATMTATVEVLEPSGLPKIDAGGLVTEARRFIIVPLEDDTEDELDRWERIEKARIRQKATEILDDFDRRARQISSKQALDCMGPIARNFMDRSYR